MLLFHFADQLQHPGAGFGIETVGRLVEDHKLRTVDDRLGQLGHLLHAQRIRAERAVARFSESDVKQDFVRLFEGNARGEAG